MNYYNEYDTPIHFKGDILITDPCYIMREEKDSLCKSVCPEIKHPEPEDYFKYGLAESDYPDLVEMEIVLSNSEADKQKSIGYVLKGQLGFEQFRKLHNGETNEVRFTITASPMYQEASTAYRKACNEYYSIPHDDWDYSNCGENMAVLGIEHCAIADTLYGDWGCTTYEIEDEVASATPEKVAEKPLGEFCAYAGLVGVFLVDEVMKYTPEAVKSLRERNWCATFIDNFDGDITFAKIKATEHNEEFGYCDSELRLVGDGNVKFVTSQTEL